MTDFSEDHKKLIELEKKLDKLEYVHYEKLKGVGPTGCFVYGGPRIEKTGKSYSVVCELGETPIPCFKGDEPKKQVKLYIKSMKPVEKPKVVEHKPKLFYL